MQKAGMMRFAPCLHTAVPVQADYHTSNYLQDELDTVIRLGEQILDFGDEDDDYREEGDEEDDNSYHVPVSERESREAWVTHPIVLTSGVLATRGSEL